MVTSLISYSYYLTNATLASTELHAIHCIQTRYRQEVHAPKGYGTDGNTDIATFRVPKRI